MPTERCWSCQQIRPGVELCPSEDRLCPACYKENERQLTKRSNPQAGTSSATSTESTLASDNIDTVISIPDVPDAKKSRAKSVKSIKNKNAAPTALATLQHAQSVVVSDSVHSQTEPLAIDHNTEELSELRKLVSGQQLVIKKLLGQVDFLLSFLGITEMQMESVTGDSSASESAIGPQNESSANLVDHGASREDEDQASWSTVAKRPQGRRHDVLQHETFQQSVVTAVYVDQTVKKHRETSVIVSGLAPNDSVSDSELFNTLCSTEFHFEPEIASTKRLGQLQADKIQPLLVHLKQGEQAKQLVANAKQLRRSTNQITRDKVYINPNLTRAEAAAAYQVRVLRRTAQLRRTRGSSTEATSSINNQELNPKADSFKPATTLTMGSSD
jgi:hypothetical protein